MTNRERVSAVLSGKPADRLPMVEWATWWNLTTKRWEKEGVPAITGPDTLQNYFGLDPLRQIWILPRGAGCPVPAYNGAGIIETPEDYQAIRPYLFTDDNLKSEVKTAEEWAEGHKRGDYAGWLTLEGFFWFPRTIFGIEPHLYAFYDYPELMHQMNRI